MSRKVILYLAVSLDGYIADADGQVAWLDAACPEQSTPSSYDQFIALIDTVIMGRRTYDQIITELSPERWPYCGLTSYVLTHPPDVDQPSIFFRSQPLSTLLQTLRQQPGRDIWLCGGADLVQQARAQNLIDRYYLTVMPVLLGQGLPLFQSGLAPTALSLQACWHEGALVNLIYDRL